MSTHSSCNDQGGFEYACEQSAQACYDMSAAIISDLQEENRKFRECMFRIQGLLYKESQQYEDGSLGEMMFLSPAQEIYELLQTKCERCGELLTIEGICECCLADKKEEYGE